MSGPSHCPGTRAAAAWQARREPDGGVEVARECATAPDPTRQKDIMIIKDIPQTGKLGLTVTWPGRNGLVRRTLVTPKNPRTATQLQVRQLLSNASRRFDTLTDDQQNAWNTAAAGYQSAPRLGQSGPLTGLQLYVRVNSKLGLLGQDPVDAPPAVAEFAAVAVASLSALNNNGTVTISLGCPTTPAPYTVLRASPPQNSAVRACRDFRIIGVCPAPAQGAANITSLYVAEFGAPPVGKRVFVRASVMVNGFESLPSEFSARVTAGGGA